MIQFPSVSPPFLTTNGVYRFLCNSEKIVINSVKKIKLVLRVQIFNSRCDLSGLYRSGDNRTFTTLMSSRLKRKLGDIGIDPSSAKANESFCLVCIKAIFFCWITYFIWADRNAPPSSREIQGQWRVRSTLETRRKAYPVENVCEYWYILRRSGTGWAGSKAFTWSFHWWVFGWIFQHGRV